MEENTMKKRIITFAIVFASLLVMSSCGNTTTNQESGIENNVVENTSNATEKNSVVFENDDYKVTYIKFEDPNVGVTAWNLLLNIENKSDKEIVAGLKDGYANDTSVFFATGIPVKIASEKKAVGAFTFGYNNLGIDNIEDVEKLEFKFVAYNSNDYSIIFESNPISIEF
jgi:hypothetical protein